MRHLAIRIGAAATGPTGRDQNGYLRKCYGFAGFYRVEHSHCAPGGLVGFAGPDQDVGVRPMGGNLNKAEGGDSLCGVKLAFDFLGGRILGALRPFGQFQQPVT